MGGIFGGGAKSRGPDPRTIELQRRQSESLDRQEARLDEEERKEKEKTAEKKRFVKGLSGQTRGFKTLFRLTGELGVQGNKGKTLGSSA